MDRTSPRSETDRRLDRFLRRFAYVRRTNVETFAQRFAELLRAGAPPRDPRSLLPRIGITVERGMVEPPARGKRVRRGDGYAITVSEHEQREAQAFAAWREVFCLLAAQRGFPTELSQVGVERLANRFATCILMPADVMMAEAGRFSTNPDALVEVLAQRFGVSLTAMRKRLYELEILRPRSRAVHLPQQGKATGSAK
ncbi:MAG: ImmA/IrrE family metallo-endopeptidase [Armatimonadota bacterium]|nr:MAG: ImmA/IrrE family metallo-endopeptidase [Armatimonadota bacterium]